MNMLTKITPEIAKVHASLDPAYLSTASFEPLCEVDQIGAYMNKIRGSETAFACAIMLASMPREKLVGYLRERLEEDMEAAVEMTGKLEQHSTDLRTHLGIAGTACARYMVAMAEAAEIPFGELFPPSPWDAAIAKYRELERAVDASDFGETERSEAAYGQLVGAWTEAADDLIEMEAPTIDALVDKLEAIDRSFDGSVIQPGVIKAVLADARRLADPNSGLS